MRFWRLRLFGYRAFNIGVVAHGRSVEEVATMVRSNLEEYANLFEIALHQVVDHMVAKEPETKK